MDVVVVESRTELYMSPMYIWEFEPYVPKYKDIELAVKLKTLVEFNVENGKYRLLVEIVEKYPTPELIDSVLIPPLPIFVVVDPTYKFFNTRIDPNTSIAKGAASGSVPYTAETFESQMGTSPGFTLT